MPQVIYVQLSNDDSEIISYFTCPQDDKYYPHQKTTDSSDNLWRLYYESLPSLMQGDMPVPE